MQVKLLILGFTFFSTLIGAQSIESELGFMEGLWRVENKETYEVWSMNESGFLEGKSYKIVNEKEVITEFLEIKNIDGNIVYQATVLNQNEGKPIGFVLTVASENEYAFENPEHDFPKKIIYKKVSDSELFVSVTGDEGKGFSFKMKKYQ